MRGVPFSDTNTYVAQSILMSKYNQPYSEIENIPLKTVLFLVNLYGAEADLQEQEVKKIKKNIPSRGKRL